MTQLSGVEELVRVNEELQKVNEKIKESTDEKRVQTLNRTKYLMVGNLQSTLETLNRSLRLRLIRRNDDRITFVFFWRGGKKQFFTNKQDLHQAINAFSKVMVGEDVEVHDIQVAGSTKIKILMEVKNVKKAVG